MSCSACVARNSVAACLSPASWSAASSPRGLPASMSQSAYTHRRAMSSGFAAICPSSDGFDGSASASRTATQDTSALGALVGLRPAPALAGERVGVVADAADREHVDVADVEHRLSVALGPAGVGLDPSGPAAQGADRV